MSASPRPSWGGGTDGGGALVQYTSLFVRYIFTCTKNRLERRTNKFVSATAGAARDVMLFCEMPG